MRIIGNVIMRRRKELKMTQNQLAEKLGVSSTFICKIETGSTPLSQKHLEGIEDALGMDFSNYFSAENQLLNKWKAVINMFEDHQLQPEDVKALIQFITHIKKTG
ncbi:helix-turn-helix domain-containing protein [Peribacillus glennii]|uniref:XRE family transcriptional regulator n=1 Tax=Peribacillus glennii TaxID=2303991 RepID=A0A372L825_9BACI|nr:helix-turn-helix transcriptional regulator [Peribacillus glennii]RFU61142.1 XRE family transcriptional regulator [Peribacillus glennii]